MKSTDWESSPEFKEAVRDYFDFIDKLQGEEAEEENIPTFQSTSFFRNARLAYRRRVNDSPYSETT